MMDIVNERTSAYISVAFTDKTGAAATPNTITYSTICQSTGTAIKTNVSVAPASTVTIALDALDSAIQAIANPYEYKLLTIKANYGASDECNGEYAWMVKNLPGV